MEGRGFRSVALVDDGVRLLDQRALPHAVEYRVFGDATAVAGAIREMVVRGAPAIGVAAAYGLAHEARQRAARGGEMLAPLHAAADTLAAARPTAVNLMWAVARMRARLTTVSGLAPGEVAAALVAEAEAMAAEDVATNLAMAEHGLPLVPDGATVIHHCNTGSLATVDYGTALGVLRLAHERGRRIHVYLDETRPRLQGAALSAWELAQQGVPHTLMVDGASGLLMARKGIAGCFVGADRIAANGDFANKIGTYNLALVARAHGVPFYVVAPTTTIDLATPDGAAIEIEERDPREVTHVQGAPVAPHGAAAWNPAFDVTPVHLVTAFVTEHGRVYPPFGEGLLRVARAGRELATPAFHP
jgi:methylthioribose-1-phosphate isomerase